MSRLDACASLKQHIKERFGFECAVCGLVSRLGADVAHLFEDATTHVARADRLIVLCSTCNQAEARTKAASMPPLSELFTADEVGASARRAYREGRFSCSYQGHRLAAYLLELRSLYSDAVASLVEAISSARPIRWGDFLRATVLEVERLCLTHAVGLVQRWLFLDRFALVLFDYRQWEESAKVQTASARLRSRVRDEPRSPEQLRFDRMSSLRREAQIQAFGGNARGRRRRRLLIDELVEHAREFEIQGHMDSYATNLDVAAKLALEIGNDPETAHKYSEGALQHAEKITHKWVLQEHYWREVGYYNLRKSRPLARKNVIEALRIFRDHPVVLEPMLGAKGLMAHNPITELSQFGISLGELREREVAPSRNPPKELPLRLSKSVVERVVTNCMKDRL